MEWNVVNLSIKEIAVPTILELLKKINLPQLKELTLDECGIQSIDDLLSFQSQSLIFLNISKNNVI